MKIEGNFASNLSPENKNRNFGFHTLSYTISEACKEVKIKVHNWHSHKEGNKVGIKTRNETAYAG